MRARPPMVSDDLRRQADGFVELHDLGPLIGRARTNPTRHADPDHDDGRA